MVTKKIAMMTRTVNPPPDTIIQKSDYFISVIIYGCEAIRTLKKATALPRPINKVNFFGNGVHLHCFATEFLSTIIYRNIFMSHKTIKALQPNNNVSTCRCCQLSAPTSEEHHNKRNHNNTMGVFEMNKYIYNAM